MAIDRMDPNQDNSDQGSGLYGIKDVSSRFEADSEDERWPIYRRPQRTYYLPAGITTLRLPSARRLNIHHDIEVQNKKDAFDIIYNHYNSCLPNPHEYSNYCGASIAVRRHEVLSCDPYFAGFVFRQNVAHIVVYDDHFHNSWCLEH
jgi:hypothetical protein